MGRQTGKRPRELDGPELPPNVAYLWQWFLELSAARGSAGFGPAAIDYCSIEAWSRLTARMVRPNEVHMLIELDRIWRGEVGKAGQARQAFLKTKQRQERPNGR